VCVTGRIYTPLHQRLSIIIIGFWRGQQRTCILPITPCRCTVWRKGPFSALAAGQVRPFLGGGTTHEVHKSYRYGFMIPLIYRHDATILARKLCPTTRRACFCARGDDKSKWTGTQRPMCHSSRLTRTIGIATNRGWGDVKEASCAAKRVIMNHRLRRTTAPARVVIHTQSRWRRQRRAAREKPAEQRCGEERASDRTGHCLYHPQGLRICHTPD
jgi:hypothetical protein